MTEANTSVCLNKSKRFSSDFFSEDSLLKGQILSQKITGKIVIYPYRSLSLELKKRMDTMEELSVVAFADSNPIDAHEEGLPVLGVDELLRSIDTYDAILVCHQLREDVLSEYLISRGVPKAKICRFYSSEFASTTMLEAISALECLEIENLICIMNDASRVLTPDNMREIYDPEKTLILTSGKVNDLLYLDQGFQVLPAMGSSNYLTKIGEIVSPAVIHFSGNADDAELALVVQNMWLQAKFIYEIYDTWSIAHTKEDPYVYAKNIYGFSKAQYEASVAAEKALFKTADLIIGKFVPLKDPIKGLSVEGRYEWVYPEVSVNECFRGGRVTSQRIAKIGYPANFPSEKSLEIFPSFQYSWGHWDLFKQLVKNYDLDVHVFNGCDLRDAGSTNLFKSVKDLCATYGIHYHSRKSRADLLEALQAMDVGWQCNKYQPDEGAPDSLEMVIQSTFCTYVAAGLPVIVSSDMRVASQLVERYAAGLVIEPNEFDCAAKKINDANLDEMRNGARNLLEEMKSHNSSVCLQIRNKFALCVQHENIVPIE